MRDFLRRTFFVDRRKQQLSTVTVDRRKKMTGDSAAQRLDESIDRFALSMKRINDKAVEVT